MEEVLHTWNLQEMVNNNLDIVLKAVGGLIFAFYALRILSEIYKVLIIHDGRFSLAQLTPIIVTFAALCCYKEIVFMIGDGFIYLAEAIRGETAEKYKYTAVVDTLMHDYKSHSPMDPSFYGFLKWIWSSTTDAVLDFLSVPFQLMASIISIIFRFIAIWGTQVCFALVIIFGPIPLALSLVPGLNGLAGHWFKSFITVCCWNVTIAILDMLVKTLDVTYLVNTVYNGNQEFAIAMISFITSVCYFFVPKLTSLMIGHTMAGHMWGIAGAIAKTATAVATKGASMAAKTGSTAAAASSSMSTPRYAGGNINSTPRALLQTGMGAPVRERK